jgi:hypothetical protein
LTIYAEISCSAGATAARCGHNDGGRIELQWWGKKMVIGGICNLQKSQEALASSRSVPA